MAHRFIPRSCAIRPGILVAVVAVGLAACGSGSDAKDPSYKIQATVVGLTDGNSVVLQVTDGGKPATVGQNGLTTLLYAPTGAKYHVAVKTPPAAPPETCTISHGEGTVGTGDVTDVVVTCSEKTFNISVSVSGLLGSGLAICENYTDGTCASAVAIPARNGPTIIRSTVADGVAYLLVFAGGQPTNPWQVCSFTNGSSDGTKAGGIIQGADVTIALACTTSQYYIAGRISGLAGTGLKLSTAGQDDVRPSPGDTSFAFANKVDSGSSYGISLTGEPTNPSQHCVVSSGSGSVGGQDTNVMVTCNTIPYAIGGAVSQLESNLELTLANQSDQTSQTLTLTGGTASFVFTSKLASGSKYQIAVKTQPASPKQLCSVSPETGVIGNADISVAVTCQTYHQISGRVLGYKGTGLAVTLSSTSPGFTPPTSSIDASGNYVFSDVLDGTYTITPSTSPSCWAMSPPSIGIAPVWNGVDSTGNNFTATLSPTLKNWCPMATMPTGSAFTSVSGSSASDVWVLTPPYTLSNWTGASWNSVTAANYVDAAPYRRLWVDAPGDVWALGVPMIDHWNGSLVPNLHSPGGPWSGVWGFGTTNIWFVAGSIANWNGSSFSNTNPCDVVHPVGIWGSSESDMWAVGVGACHLSGGSWTTGSAGTTNALNDIWGSWKYDIWAVGVAGTIVHLGAGQWSPSPYSGVTTNKDLNRIWGSGPNVAWAVGAGGTILRWDGSAWTKVPSGTSADLTGVWGSGSKDVWAVGGDTILRWQDQ